MDPNMRQALSYAQLVRANPDIIKADIAYDNQRNAIDRAARRIDTTYDAAKAAGFGRQPGAFMFSPTQRGRTARGYIKMLDSKRQQYQNDIIGPVGKYGDQVLGGKYSLDLLKPIIKEAVDRTHGEHTSHLPNEVVANIARYMQPSQFSLPELTRGMASVADIRKPFSETMFDRASRNVIAAGVNLAQPAMRGPNLPTMDEVADTIMR